MQHECFRGSDMKEAMLKVRASLGEEAMILSSRTVDGAEGPSAEIVAAKPEAVDAFRLGLNWASPKLSGTEASRRVGPRYFALVGPPGAGKTLTAVKMALSEHALGGQRVGFLTLDTYRVGAVDELQSYAEILNAPLEVVYSRKEIRSAAERLRSCDAVIVDTPGRTPDAAGRLGPWEDIIRQIKPHEVHLVLPAGTRLDVAEHQRESLKELGITHFLPTKLDHVPGDSGLGNLVERIGLPTRWIADGHEIPGDLRPAGPRVLTALGTEAPEEVEDIQIRVAS